VNSKQALTLITLIALLSYSCYKLGQGNAVIIEKTVEKIVEVKVYDAGFCASCYKEHTWNDMYVLMNKYTDSITNKTNQ